MSNLNRAQLDNNVIQIELTLISIVQGLAMSQLSANALEPINNLQLEYWPYIVAGFILILLFWTQAIVHTLSFIQWPLELSHNFLYFLIMFIEFMMFSHITHPLLWFVYNFLFFIVAGLLYILDSYFLAQRREDYASKEALWLFQDIMHEQRVNLRVYVPLGLFYMLASTIGLYFLPEYFITQKYHIILGAGQMIIGGIVLLRYFQHFHYRALLITRMKKRIND